MNLDSNFIKFTLDIKDPNLSFIDYCYKFFHGIKCKMYVAILDISRCSQCGSTNFVKNGRYKSYIRYITANASNPVLIKIFKQRILCRNCHTSSMAASPLIDKYCYISNTVKQKITANLTEDRSLISIAKENNVSPNTVQRQLEKFEDKFINEIQEDLPAHLAFDEFRGVGRKLHFICIDGDSHNIIKILPTRYKKDIIAYFNKFSPQALAKVETVSMDLNSYYPEIARMMFPNAKIILDRFHMVQMLARSFNSMRVQVMKQFDKKSLEYKLLKYHWKLYLKKYSDLNKTRPLYDWHIKDCLTQEQIVVDGLGCDKALANSYYLMQDFMEALDNKDSEKIRELLQANISVGSQMATTLRTFNHYLSGVLNGVSSPYSNGCLEGKNRKIKQIQRTAYGYRNFKHMIIRIRLEEDIAIKEKHQALAA